VMFGGRIMETFDVDDIEKVDRIGLLMAGIVSETELSWRLRGDFWSSLSAAYSHFYSYYFL